MNIKKIVIASGCYKEQEKRLLVSFDSQDKAVDIMDLDNTMVGIVTLATVEKVLNDLDGCILNLKELGIKAFIENKSLNPEKYVKRHSLNKLVCQADEFYVTITQDKKANKPCTCIFSDADRASEFPFLDYYLKEVVAGPCSLVAEDVIPVVDPVEFSLYKDEEISLWQLYNITGILDKVLSKRCYLKNDANIVIECTEALTVVDVNTGKGAKKKDYFETNMLCASELMKQLRLRNISGMIVVDFLKPMNDVQKSDIIHEVKRAGKDDYCQIKVYDFTALGLLEITRSRKFSPLAEFF